MFRRWIIRSCFLVPIMLCISGWWWSAGHNVRIVHSQVGYATICGINGGVVYWERMPSADPPLTPWYLEVISVNFRLADDDYFETSTVPGFNYMLGSTHDWSVISMPFWFLIAISSAVLFFVRRMTRPKPNPAAALPVEVKASGTP